jgi:hypothetical protein
MKDFSPRRRDRGEELLNDEVCDTLIGSVQADTLVEENYRTKKRPFGYAQDKLPTDDDSSKADDFSNYFFTKAF